jgi:hypothetical protein
MMKNNTNMLVWMQIKDQCERMSFQWHQRDWDSLWRMVEEDARIWWHISRVKL